MVTEERPEGFDEQRRRRGEKKGKKKEGKGVGGGGGENGSSRANIMGDLNTTKRDEAS